MTPFRNATTAKSLLDRHYGLSGELNPLESYADINFKVLDPSGQPYVLKFSLSETDPQVVSAQNQVLCHLADRDPGLAVPKVILTRDGRDSVDLSEGNAPPIIMRLLSFLPGQLWYQADTQDNAFLGKVGAFMGRLDHALADFRHPGVERHLVWDLANSGEVFEKTEAIEDPHQRLLAQYLLTQFDALVKPVLGKLPQQTIHNDGNDYNVLVSKSENEWDVSGLIDFGDMVYTARCCEVAIAAAYAVLGKADPVSAAAALIAGYHRVNPLVDEELEMVFHLIRTRLAVSVTMSAIGKLANPDNDYLLVTEAPAWRALETLMSVPPTQALGVFREVCGLAKIALPGRSPKELVAAREKRLGPSLSLSYGEPLKMVRGWKQYLIDHLGRAFVDGVNNVCHVGHCHPHVVDRIASQAAVLNTNTRYLHDHIVELAERLTATLPDPLSVVYFVNSGSEANDLALRLARVYTGGDEVIVLEGAYHGNLSSLIEISPYKYSGPGGRGPGQKVNQVPLPDGFRGPIKGQGPETGEAYARFVSEKARDIVDSDNKLAAFFCESLPGCGGQILLPETYLKHAYKSVREAGGVCISDEVQVGFGRVGQAFWGFELQDVVPDIVTLGKPMGNGHPIAAVVTTQSIAEAFANGMEYFNTFGGNPVSCAAGLAVLEVLEVEDRMAHAARLGQWLLGELRALQRDFPLIGDVRGAGLFIGIELVRDSALTPATEEAKALVNRMRHLGILLSIDGPLNNVIKFKPPLPFDKHNARFLVDTLRFCLSNLTPAPHI